MKRSYQRLSDIDGIHPRSLILNMLNVLYVKKKCCISLCYFSLFRCINMRFHINAYEFNSFVALIIQNTVMLLFCNPNKIYMLQLVCV